MKIKLIWIALLVFSNNAYSLQSFEDFLKNNDIGKAQFLRIDCNRVSNYSKNHVVEIPNKNSYARPNLYDSIHIEQKILNGTKSYSFFWENSSKSKYREEYDRYIEIYYEISRYKNLKVNRETENLIVFQTPKDVNDRVDIYELNKTNGNLKMHVWEIKTTETRPNDTFKFKQESAKKELVHTETIQFNCK